MVNGKLDHVMKDADFGFANVVAMVNQDSEGSGEKSPGSFSGFMRNGSSMVLADEHEIDEELRLYLECIELLYQQAIKDISQKREQAIATGKQRAFQRKQFLFH